MVDAAPEVLTALKVTSPSFGAGKSTSKTVEEVTLELDAYSEYKSAVVIRVLGTIFIVGMATLGNPLSFTVLRSKRLKHSTTSILLSFLALVDSLTVYLALVPQTISFASDKDVKLTSDFACKFFWFTPLFLTELSSWVLVLVSFERMVAVWLPAKMKSISTPKSARIALCFVTIVLFMVNTRYFFTKTLMVDKCVPNPKFVYFENAASVWLSRMLYWGCPSTIMLLGNLLIFVKISQLRHVGQNTMAGRFKNKTTITIVKSFAFMACTTPLVVFNIIYEGWHRNPRDIMVKYELAYSVLHFLAYLNYAINFILYCAVGNRFREEFQYVVMRKSRVVWPEATSTSHQPRRARLESRMEVGFRLDTGFGSQVTDS